MRGGFWETRSRELTGSGRFHPFVAGTEGVDENACETADTAAALPAASTPPFPFPANKSGREAKYLRGIG